MTEEDDPAQPVCVGRNGRNASEPGAHGDDVNRRALTGEAKAEVARSPRRRRQLDPSVGARAGEPVERVVDAGER